MRQEKRVLGGIVALALSSAAFADSVVYDSVDDVNPWGLISTTGDASGSKFLQDDFTGIKPGVNNLFLSQLRLLGGAVSVNEGGAGGKSIRIDFFAENGSFKGGFSHTLETFGLTLHTILVPQGTVVPFDNKGFIRITPSAVDGSNPATTFTLAYTDKTTLGSNQGSQNADGTAAGTIYMFELTETPVPSPNGIGILAIIGVYAGWRRKR